MAMAMQTVKRSALGVGQGGGLLRPSLRAPPASRRTGAALPGLDFARIPIQPAQPGLQRKLAIGPANDVFEREADRVAHTVMRMGPPQTAAIAAAPAATLARKCACGGETEDGGECAECRAKREAGLQRRAVTPAAPASAPPIVHDVLRGPGRPLDPAARSFLEPRFGHDFSRVRVHSDAPAAESARAVNALAYTVGHDVVFGAGQYAPGAPGGMRLLAHELTHVVQQSGGAARSVQRQGLGGPLDLKPDVCVTPPGLGKMCGQKAADVCKETPGIPGCNIICKAFDCGKPPGSKTQCPPGWRGATSKDFAGQCCLGGIDNAQSCCASDRIGALDFPPRCCGPNEDAIAGHCKKREAPPDLCLPGQKTLLGECCVLPLVPKGAACGPPDAPVPPPAPKPAATAPAAIDISFRLDRPSSGEGAGKLADATTPGGKAQFDTLVTALKADSRLKVMLVGHASPEGADDYNFELAARRARMVAEALKGAGIPSTQVADDPAATFPAGCKPLTPAQAGLRTCGEVGASGESDRKVTAGPFTTAP